MVKGLVVADLQPATVINQRGLHQYYVQASFLCPIVVTLQFMSAQRRRIAVLGCFWKSGLRVMK